MQLPVGRLSNKSDDDYDYDDDDGTELLLSVAAMWLSSALYLPLSDVDVRLCINASSMSSVPAHVMLPLTELVERYGC